MDSSELPLLQARMPLTDLNQYPTSRFQVEMLVLIYFTATLAYCTYGLRIYSRFSTKQIGLGKYDGTKSDFSAFFGPWC